MKKFVLLISLCASFIAACDEGVAPVAHEPSLTFQVSALDMFNTRADIYSTDALQSIDGCKVYVFQSTDNGASYKYVKTFDFDPLWTKGWNSVTHRLSKDEMLPNGMYRFLAVGMDGLTDYTVTTLNVGDDYSTVAATLNAAIPQELFSGITDYTISSSIETVRVLMHRRVAGVLGYFTNVPATIGGLEVKTLRLTVAGSNTVVDIASNPNAQLQPAAATRPGYNIFNVDLTTQSKANGIYTGTPEVGGVSKVSNTTLVGAYVIPAGFSTGSATLTLSLLGGADGTVVLRSWPVLDESGANIFDIRQNHIYALGRKLQAANTTNGNDDPSDDDAPIDFAAQTIVANINAGWDTRHQLTLDETNVGGASTQGN